MTKFGLGMELFQFSRELAVFGILVSILGVIGGIALIVHAHIASSSLSPKLFYGAGAVILIIMLPYLAMWITLKIKASKEDILGIERIGKVYSYFSGSLEIIGMIIYFGMVIEMARYDQAGIGFLVGVICWLVHLYFIFLKIHGVRVEKNKLLGAYIGFRYVLFILYMAGLIILSATTGNFAWIEFIVGSSFFILDTGLPVILHSIRVDRENTAVIGTEISTSSSTLASSSSATASAI